MTESTRIKKELTGSLKDKYPWVTRKDIACEATNRGTYTVNLKPDNRIVCRMAVVRFHFIKLGYECVATHLRSAISFAAWDAEVFPRSTK